MQLNHIDRLGLGLTSPNDHEIVEQLLILMVSNTYEKALRLMYKALRSAGGIRRPLRLLRKEK